METFYAAERLITVSMPCENLRELDIFCEPSQAKRIYIYSTRRMWPAAEGI